MPLWNNWYLEARGNKWGDSREGHVLHPKGEGGEGVESVCTRVVLEKAATIAPASTFVLLSLWGFPMPCPFVSYRRASVGSKITNKLNIRILMYIGVGVKLACDQCIQLFSILCVGKCESANGSIDG